MRMLMTGGAGFIGSASVRALEGAGHEVTVLDSLREDVHGGRTPVLPAGVRLVVGDVRDLDLLRVELVGIDRVVHLAAKVGLGVDIDDIDDYVATNDLGTATVLRAAAAADVPHFVFASSMVVYGEGAYDCARHGRVPAQVRRVPDLEAGVFDPRCPRCDAVLTPGLVTEDAPLDPRNVYAATKVHGEHLLAAWVRETGGSATALRFHNVYGPGMPRDTPYAGVAAIFRSALAAGRAPEVFEDGGQRRDFVHVDDVAAAVALAAGVGTTADVDDAHWRAADGSAEPAGALTALNIGSGTVTTIGELARALARALDGPEPVVTGRYRAGDVRHVTASAERAASVLAWRARIDLAAGIDSLLSGAG